MNSRLNYLIELSRQMLGKSLCYMLEADSFLGQPCYSSSACQHFDFFFHLRIFKLNFLILSLIQLHLTITSDTSGKPKGVLYSHRGAYLNTLGECTQACFTVK